MKKREKPTEARGQNLVAKHAHQFNRAYTFCDRKKAEKRGARKHKGQWPCLSAFKSAFRQGYSVSSMSYHH